MAVLTWGRVLQVGGAASGASDVFTSSASGAKGVAPPPPPHPKKKKKKKVDSRLHGKGKSKSHGARPVYYNNLDDIVNSDQ